MPTPTPRFIAQELAAWAERNPYAAYQLVAAAAYRDDVAVVNVTLYPGPQEPTVDEVLRMSCSDDVRLVLLFDHTQQAIARKAISKSTRAA